ncbi:hypothetical protein BY458DRAFT_176881 [Sporodiniella umbellata]|nr:hypothetical protein BY458DRAFT_176881 [Sporodiniella umbellata]
MEEEEFIDIGQDDEEQDRETPIFNDNSLLIDQEMDLESRQLIEQMLAEEEFYYGKSSMESIGSKKKKVNTSTGIVKKKGLSSASLPSHKTRWSKDEDDKLLEAIKKFGYGNWKDISEYMGTRNRLQCKNHARHLQSAEKLKVPEKDDKKLQEMKENNIQDEKLPANIELVQKENMLVEDSNLIPKRDEATNNLESGNSDNHDKDSNGSDDDDDLLDIGDAIIVENDIVFTVVDAVSEKSESPAPVAEELMNTESNQEASTESISSEKSEREHTYDFPVDDIPREHESYDRFYVSEKEMMHNPEWFRQKYAKTPDRYLKIRNHILDCWYKCQPKYLTKTQGRKGLKDCGDVNAIGRVHSYLERVGAINTECERSPPKPPKRTPRETLIEEEEIFDAADLVVNYEGPRKRKVRNERGEWVDPKELEGRVIEHGVPIVENEQKPKRIKQLFHQHYYTGDDFNRGYDPFRLVPTLHYNDIVTPPFEVNILSDALLVMDFHSHLAHTEIIGLLGGNFVKRTGTKVLQVRSVFPCKSTSTGIQCEMDPASEMRAREVFAEQGYNVVGWYHSHPTFEPHPSIRDIENQTSYQTLFREESTGDEPFVGVIVTPYNVEAQSELSQFQYLHISKEWDDSHSYRVPYSCKKMVEQCEQVSPNVLDQLRGLICEYKDYEHKVDMSLGFGSGSRLEKLMDSLRSHVFMKEEQESLFLNQVKEIIEKEGGHSI